MNALRDYKALLKQAGLLYLMYEAGRPDPFNVFSVLRRESDEVNLHSRFLAALLDHRKSRDAPRENLKDFLENVVECKFEHDSAEVDRERDGIDILIVNKAKQAVAIENKIDAGDQPGQLQRYHDKLEKNGYNEIHMLYLTLHGHDPSEESRGALSIDKIINISYKSDLRPWLERCQERACDEPPLRESVAQYLHLIQKMTGTDQGEAYMSELKKLCLEDNNPVLVHDLNRVMVEVMVSLQHQLWEDIEKALDKIPNFPDKDKNNSNTSRDMIEGFVTGKRGCGEYGLYYPLDGNGASLSVDVETGDSRIGFGIKCSEELHPDEHSRLKEKLKDMSGESAEWWPWFKYADGDLYLKPLDGESLSKSLALLSKDEARKKFAAGIACGLKRVWDKVKPTSGGSP